MNELKYCDRAECASRFDEASRRWVCEYGGEACLLPKPPELQLTPDQRREKQRLYQRNHYQRRKAGLPSPSGYADTLTGEEWMEKRRAAARDYHRARKVRDGLVPCAARDVPAGESWAFTDHRTQAEVA